MKRSRLSAFVLAVLLVAGLGWNEPGASEPPRPGVATAAGTQGQGSATTGQGRSGQRAAGPRSEATSPAGGRKGVAADLFGLSADALNATLDDMVRLGVTFVRVDFDWSHMQPRRDFYNVEAHDRVARAVQAHGLRLLGIIDYTPEWANGGAGTKLHPPVDAADYGRFAGYLAQRYKHFGVHDWEIWNEPNLGSVFWRSGADPARYAGLLKSAYPEIKRADPGATVITAGLAPAADEGLDMRPQTFLDGVYRAGGRGFFDHVGHHPYVSPALPSATDGSAFWWTAMDDLRAIMVKNGDGAKAIWMTEFGAPTAGGPGAVDEARQAAIIADGFRLQQRAAWLGPLIVYAYQDAGTDPSTQENFFGLLRADGSRKPAWEAFRQAPP
ncbi:hypothetical protein PQJ75_24095 [Rhodoplanes sp. TEM]|uniref:Glycoside hydrolase family 5 domain-containing protein n=1 Tax=Rhodoplanes tepidamans TaxID=200616 RepID=A0ABT5JCW3_RHOTP|nr:MULTISPECIES: hypothetical protein [Rhodoplanes]MDC7787114.1 hypothetical protein [Rhodoplanes tepidamans]MDC7986822.1 hypothetical protein [Rhodoplanes sp. TEM]MDQ0358715.1 hypothetical protein [Rhodoplanes tepidamans]